VGSELHAASNENITSSASDLSVEGHWLEKQVILLSENVCSNTWGMPYP
jgi:hypothetical protein